jgi:predicted dehydrogenase
VTARPIRIGIAGVGKIARDQHIPSIAANPAYRLTAACSRHAQVKGVETFRDIEQMLAGAAELDAVAICTPPQMHYQAAKAALLKGKHVLLEKPPCTSLAEFDHLVQLAQKAGRTLYQTWHSQHADAVAPAAVLLQSRRLKRARVAWKEDVRRWHPGQAWIWEAGGFGILDPGINAISILTRLFDEALLPRSVTLFVPANCQTPIAAEITLETGGGAEIQMELDFRHTGTQTWDILLETDAEPITLSSGGALLSLGDAPVPTASGDLHGEYRSIYRRFAELVARGQSEADARPMRLVADIFLMGKRIPVEPFIE